MGKLTCTFCGAVGQGETRDEADAAIDHAVGLRRGRHCSGQHTMLWDGAEKKPSKESKTTPKKGDQKPKGSKK